MGSFKGPRRLRGRNSAGSATPRRGTTRGSGTAQRAGKPTPQGNPQTVSRSRGRRCWGPGRATVVMTGAGGAPAAQRSRAPPVLRRPAREFVLHGKSGRGRGWGPAAGGPGRRGTGGRSYPPVEHPDVIAGQGHVRGPWRFRRAVARGLWRTRSRAGSGARGGGLGRLAFPGKKWRPHDRLAGAPAFGSSQGRGVRAVPGSAVGRGYPGSQSDPHLATIGRPGHPPGPGRGRSWPLAFPGELGSPRLVTVSRRTLSRGLLLWPGGAGPGSSSKAGRGRQGRRFRWGASCHWKHPGLPWVSSRRFGGRLVSGAKNNIRHRCCVAKVFMRPRGTVGGPAANLAFPLLRLPLTGPGALGQTFAWAERGWPGPGAAKTVPSSGWVPTGSESTAEPLHVERGPRSCSQGFEGPRARRHSGPGDHPAAPRSGYTLIFQLARQAGGPATQDYS